MKRKLSLILTFCILFGSAFAQATDNTNSSNDLSANEFTGSVQIALSNADYMVTAGDVYSLTYSANGTPVSYTIPVDPSYKLRIANLAVFDATGKSYIQLKKNVEEIVQKNFPMSGVQFVLLNPASFKVVVTGEVKSTVERNAWALTRLSSVISGTTTAYSSIRDVTVTSTNGRKRVYDIFKAQRDGDLSQNPYLRPGDVITINRINRVVTVNGAVERPGNYELMKGENLKDLIAYYGNGLTELADTTRIELVRSRDNLDVGGEKIYLTQKDIDNNFALLNRDVISIKNKSDLLPYINVEGIINISDAATAEALDDSTVKDSIRTRTIKFYEGENYASLIRRYEGMFNSYSDLVNSYIERGDSKIALNLQEIIEDVLFVSPYNVQRGDKLVVPFVQHFVDVLIDGEVNSVRKESAWPLRRLSTILEGNLTAYSSTRNVMVTGVDGKISYYDLFKSSRDGKLEQNPYIHAGETITVQRLERKVTVNGAVERPGTYEIKNGENLKDLIDYYGNGLTDFADTTRITLLRTRNTSAKAGETIYLTEASIDQNYTLLNGDVITISSVSELMPSIIVEGIINNPNSNADNATNDAKNSDNSSPIDQSYRTSIRFHEGENYATLVRRISGTFSTYSDLRNAYVERDGNKIVMNLEQILYDNSFMSPYSPKADDKLVIPFMQNFQKILINGEVNTVREEDAWPLRRLSAIIQGNTTEFSSTRNIKVVDVEGVAKYYDLFKASRNGDLSQDPYIRSGETITIPRMDRKVTIAGAVERPGTYELLPWENLQELIKVYGNGLRMQADLSRVEITKIIDTESVTGEKRYLTQEEAESDYPLSCYDSVYINSYSSLKPVMFAEGAIASTENANLETSTRIPVQFEPGTHYDHFIRNHANWFTATSDMERAYIIRGEERININIAHILYNKDYYSDIKIESGDILRVPYKQYFVTVSGAVINPGRYPYIPDRTYDYYVSLAGGFIKEKNAFDAVDIIDIDGKKLKKSDVITPETKITAEYNSSMYKFNQYSGVVTTVLSLLTTALSAYAVIKANSK